MSGGGAKGAMAVHGIPLRDLCAGLFIVGVGAYAVWEASAYPFGTLDSIGSGFFPVMLGLLALPLGAGVWWEAATRPAEPVSEDDGDAIEWRSIFAIIGALLAFALLIDRAGLAPAVFAAAAIASFAERTVRPIGILLLAAGLAAACVAIFVFGLKLPIRVFPG